MSRISWVLVTVCFVLTFCAATVKADLYLGPCLDETACCSTVYAACITDQRKRATILEYGIAFPIVVQLQLAAGLPADGCEEGDILVVCADKGDPGTDLLFQTGSPFPDDCGVGSQCIGSCDPKLGGTAICDCNVLSDACCGFDCVTPSADFCTPAVCQLPGPTCVTGPARGDGIACPGPSFACSASVCQGGTCVEEALPFGARCLDGYTDSVSTTLCDLAYCDGVTLGGGGCIVEDKCQLGVGFDEQCSVAVCNAQTGDCSVQHLAAGTQCSDGNLCTVGDQCNGQGVCLSGEGTCVSPSASPSSSRTPSTSRLPSASSTKSASRTPSQSTSPSTTSVPSASPSSSASSSSTASASATASRAPSASPSATPSRSQSASSTPSASEEPECFVGCSLSKGGVRNAKGLSPVWELPDVANFTVCNQSMMHWMDAKIAGKNANVPAGVDANDYKTWLKWLQQAWTVAFSLRRFGCSEPRPELVAIQFQTAWEWLSNPDNCYVPSPNASSDEIIFDKWANGEYATGSYDEFSGPVSCDDCECACWSYDELASGDNNCSCVDCLSQTDLSPASSHAKRSMPLASVLSAGQDYRVTCCLPSLQELLRDANAATKLCDGITLVNAIDGADRAKRALALARLNVDACIMAPVYAQNAYLRLLNELERKCDGEAVADEDLSVFVETLELYNNGSYGLLGGPCACSDIQCLSAQSAYVSRPASSINEIVPAPSSSKPSTRSSHTGKLSAGAIVGIVLGGLLAVMLVVVLVAGLYVWLGNRKSRGDAESDRTHLFDTVNGGSGGDDDRDY